ncbi:MAG TPA: succinate dehydrogenase, hydrophobic membrane anchor protein [Steroidobacteraceae bacterium]|nr:succinate dehydrogenase, hydrophobic membrane anchor protein [Steroidobacteraceae bacterium]
MSLRSPLRQVLGGGAAGSGVHHWWVQRLTAIALVPLTAWFVVSLLSLPGLDHATVVTWMRQSSTALLLILLLLTASWHSQLGVQVVVEDYVPPGPRTLALVVVTFVHVLLAVAGVFAVLKVALGGAA